MSTTATVPDCHHIDIYFGNDLFCIRKVPCRKIVFHRDPLACHGGGGGEEGLIGHVEFGTLAPKQRAQLRYLLRLMDPGGVYGEEEARVALCRTGDTLPPPRPHTPPD